MVEMPSETKPTTASDVSAVASDMKSKKPMSPVHGSNAGIVRVGLLDGSILDVTIDVSTHDETHTIPRT